MTRRGPGLLATMRRMTMRRRPVATDLADKLAQLEELNAAGALTDEEFAAAKAKLLSR